MRSIPENSGSTSTSAVQSSSDGCQLTGSAIASTPSGRLRAASGTSGEGADPGDVPAHDQRLDGLGALVGVQHLDVGHVADHVVLEQDPVAPQQVTGLGDHLPCLAGVVEL